MSGTAAVCRVTLVGNGTLLADRVRAAHTHWTRLRGLLGTRALEPGAGLWLMPCRQVHMIGMQYPVDVAFLDDDLRVVETVATLRPGKISRKVADATSALELPAGQLAAHGIANGARLAIEPAPGYTTVPATGFSAAFVNLFLAAIFGFFASAHFAAGMRTGQWFVIAPIVLQETMMIALILTRRRSNAVSTEPAAWVAGVIGTFSPFMFRPTDVSGMSAVGIPIQILGLLLSSTALASLGRSFGLIPAHRGIQTSGLYNFVRHPMYTAHLIGYVGYLISYPSPRNAIIGTVTALALNLRASFEERLLTRDPSYAAYLRRVSWRFLPRLY